jgi:16S rRNA (cytosine1402-N4)-methyltransferase
MLFTPPTLTLATVHFTVAPATSARVSALGFLSDKAAGSGQHAAGSMLTDARTACHGWLSVRHPFTFIAQRAKSLGTELFAHFETRFRAACHGWLSARTSQVFLFSGEMAGSGQHAISPMLTDARTVFHGWLAVRRLVTFIGEQLEEVGTPLQQLCVTMRRPASRVLSARPSAHFLSGQNGKLGTVSRGVDEQTDACAAPGWLSAQASVHFSKNSAAAEYHLPVLPAETAEQMAAGPGKFIIDGTLGGGGHSELFLQAGAKVLGVDRDPEALAHARARLADFGDRFTTWEGNFSGIQEIPAIAQGELADGLLMDLGVSSRQLDSAARGFSFMREGPLDMRMGPSSPRTAADIVNGWPEADIVRILFEYGEESNARRIAGAIVRQRTTQPFITTLDLANCIEKAIGRHGRTHPATKTFQAIRMAVNEELESLTTALAAAPKVLKPGGRLLIITFHSLEDRLVKRFLKHRSSAFLDEPGWPEPRPNPDYQFRLIARKAIAPSAAEISQNPRARSAKLRVAELIDLKP